MKRVEQLSVVLRALILNETLSRFEIQEYFMGFFEATDQTGQGLADEIIDQLQKLDLDITNIRGQGYDNGANMKGVKRGVQARISQKNSRAAFIPCACDSLNLVINDAASCSCEITGFFGIIQKIYVFFSSSPKRWSVLSSHLSNLTLKPLSTTRRSGRIDALKPLRYQLGDIYNALLDIVENSNTDSETRNKGTGENSNTDSETRNKGTGLAKNLKNYKFICSLIMWYEVLFQVNKVPLNLQSPNVNLPECANLLDQVIKYLQSYRAEGFQKMQASAKELADDLEIIAEFEREEVIRRRRKKRQFQYESVDEVPQNSMNL
ncbi:hypothetical protein QE152_g2028 [Popillia japonica]|uniref:DUF4371 domain-containing protein n=1 Tax=Popillia japonica TaxID=7064 RepID=A0AAW1N0R6_POPJA